MFSDPVLTALMRRHLPMLVIVLLLQPAFAPDATAQDACVALLDPAYVARADFNQIDECLAGAVTLPIPRQDGSGAIHVMARVGTDPTAVARLVAEGADVRAGVDCVRDWRDGYLASCTEPLHIAAARPDGFEMAAALLALGADREAPDGQDRSALRAALDTNPLSYDSLALLARGNWQDLQSSRPRWIPAATTDCAGFLTRDFFMTAGLDEVGTCLDRGAQPLQTDRGGNTPLHLAASGSDGAVIDLLLQRVAAEDPSLVETALKQRNSEGRTPLHLAAELAPSAATLNRLLAWGADPDLLSGQQTGRAVAALHLAVQRQGAERDAMIFVLLAHGARADVTDRADNDRGGRQPLHNLVPRNPGLGIVTMLLAAERHQEQIYRCPIESWCFVQDDRDQTALHAAAINDVAFSIIQELLNYGFDPDAQDTDDVTPLMRYAESGTSPATIALMLARSEYPCRPSSHGTTVLTYLQNNAALIDLPINPVELSPLARYMLRCP